MVNAAASHGAVRLCYFFLCLHEFLLSTTLSPAYSRLALNVHRYVIIPWLSLVWWCPFLSLPSLDLWPMHVLSSFLILINLVFLFWLQNSPSLFLSLLSLPLSPLPSPLPLFSQILLKTDVRATAELVVMDFPLEVSDITHRIRQNPDLQFEFLQGVFDPK